MNSIIVIGIENGVGAVVYSIEPNGKIDREILDSNSVLPNDVATWEQRAASSGLQLHKLQVGSVELDNVEKMYQQYITGLQQQQAAQQQAAYQAQQQQAAQPDPNAQQQPVQQNGSQPDPNVQQTQSASMDQFLEQQTMERFINSFNKLTEEQQNSILKKISMYKDFKQDVSPTKFLPDIENMLHENEVKKEEEEKAKQQEERKKIEDEEKKKKEAEEEKKQAITREKLANFEYVPGHNPKYTIKSKGDAFAPGIVPSITTVLSTVAIVGGFACFGWYSILPGVVTMAAGGTGLIASLRSKSFKEMCERIEKYNSEHRSWKKSKNEYEKNERAEQKAANKAAKQAERERQAQERANQNENQNGMDPIVQQQPNPQPQPIGYDQNGQPIYGQPMMQPQIMGYDQNGQPIYGQPMMQPQIMGYDQNGQPIYGQPGFNPYQPQPMNNGGFPLNPIYTDPNQINQNNQGGRTF